LALQYGYKLLNERISNTMTNHGQSLHEYEVNVGFSLLL